MPKEPQLTEKNQEPKRRGRPPKSENGVSAPVKGKPVKNVSMANPGDLSYNQLTKFYQENQGALKVLAAQKKEAEQRAVDSEKVINVLKASIMKVATAFEAVVSYISASPGTIKAKKAGAITQTEKSVKEANDETAPKKRGRPKAVQAASMATIETAPKKRGRPAKATNLVVVEAATEAPDDAPKKRGRPAKATGPSFLAPKARKSVEAAKNGIKKAKAVQTAYTQDLLD